jgi:hypothetical protein
VSCSRQFPGGSGVWRLSAVARCFRGDPAGCHERLVHCVGRQERVVHDVGGRCLGDAGCVETRVVSAGVANTPTGTANTPIGTANRPTGVANMPTGMANTSTGTANTLVGVANTPAGVVNKPIGGHPPRTTRRVGCCGRRVGHSAQPKSPTPSPALSSGGVPRSSLSAGADGSGFRGSEDASCPQPPRGVDNSGCGANFRYGP